MTAVPPEIRLSAPAEAGAEASNAYHYLIQLSGLYGDAASIDHRASGTAVWRDAAEHVLLDVGDMFHVWEMIRAKPQRQPPPKAYDAFGRSIVRASRRASRLNALLGEWSPMMKWAEGLRLLERRWQLIIEQIAEREPSEMTRLSHLRKRSMDRQSRLKGVAEMLRTERLRLSAASTHKVGA